MESPKIHIGQRWSKLVLYAHVHYPKYIQTMHTVLLSMCAQGKTRRHKTYHISYSGCYPKSSLSCCLECWDVWMWINSLLRGILLLCCYHVWACCRHASTKQPTNHYSLFRLLSRKSILLVLRCGCSAWTIDKGEFYYHHQTRCTNYKKLQKGVTYFPWYRTCVTKLLRSSCSTIWVASVAGGLFRGLCGSIVGESLISIHCAGASVE